MARARGGDMHWGEWGVGFKELCVAQMLRRAKKMKKKKSCEPADACVARMVCQVYRTPLESLCSEQAGRWEAATSSAQLNMKPGSTKTSWAHGSESTFTAWSQHQVQAQVLLQMILEWLGVAQSGRPSSERETNNLFS